MHALMFEEFLVREAALGRLNLPLKPIAKRALVHGHCHQKAFGMMGAVERILKLIPDLKVETVESSCCGMAGAFGYGADTIDVSLAMGELSLLPAVRKADADTLIVADGTSCRHQIHDGAQRDALHVARVLAMSLLRPHPEERASASRSGQDAAPPSFERRSRLSKAALRSAPSGSDQSPFRYTTLPPTTVISAFVSRIASGGTDENVLRQHREIGELAGLDAAALLLHAHDARVVDGVERQRLLRA